MGKSKVNVLFITNGLGVGGAEKLLVEIVNRIDLNKIQPTIVSINSDKEFVPSILPNRVDLYTFSRSWRYDLSPALKIRKLLTEREIDIVIPFAMFDYFFSRIATLGWQNHPRTKIYIHSTVPPTRKWFLQNWIYTRLLRDDDKFIAVCDAQAVYWSKTYGIPLEKFTTVYGGVDVAHFDYSLDELRGRDIRKEYGIPSDAYVILQVASFREYKRHEDALEALSIISGQIQHPVYLLLVGSGTVLRTSLLMRIAQDLGITERVYFCGEQQDVRSFINEADVFTLTSSTGETFSIAALEAMAMGVPCVLTDVGGARELIVDGKNGFLVEAGNPISVAAGWFNVLTQRDLFDKGQVRKIVENRFSIQRLIIDFEDILTKRD